MKFLFITIILSTFSASEAKDKAIYGQDDRQEITDIRDIKIRSNALAVAAQIDKTFLSKDPIFEIEYLLDTQLKLSSSDGRNVCLDERFALQTTIADCSGFLIAEDILLTSAHCVTVEKGELRHAVTRACERKAWVFNYENLGSRRVESIHKSGVYNCKEIIYSEKSRHRDFAFIRLDRKVKGIKPLELDTEKPKKGTKTYLISHPAGLPKKYSDNAIVLRSKGRHHFYSNLDSFEGSSGAPVFNEETHKVIGLVDSGEIDFIKDESQSCNRINICEQEGGKCAVKKSHGREVILKMYSLRKILEQVIKKGT